MAVSLNPVNILGNLVGEVFPQGGAIVGGSNNAASRSLGGGSAAPISTLGENSASGVDRTASIPRFEETLLVFSQYVQQMGMDVSFESDHTSGRFVIRVFDNSGSLLRQIPSEEVLALIHRMRSDGALRILDQKA